MFVSTRQAAAILDTSPPEAGKLGRSGLLGVSTRVGNTLAYARADVEALRWDSIPAEHPAAFVVRVGPAAPDAPGSSRLFRGYGVTYTAGDDVEGRAIRRHALDEVIAATRPTGTPSVDDQIRKAAVSRWWPIADPVAWVGELLVAALCGWVVGVWTIADYVHGDGHPRIGFTLTDPPREAARYFLRHRLHLPGGPVAYPLASALQQHRS